MAILTGTTVFSFFTIQILILVTSTKADPKIEMQPSKISLGLSSSLDINCSFSATDHPEMAAFASLILSKANSSGQNFQDVAAITEFSPDSVTVLTTEKVSATGVHSQTGESFIELTWDYPTATQAGVYQCAANGLDTLGHPLEMVNISTVIVDEANLNDMFEKLKQMEIHETAMENKMSDMENHIEALEYNNSQMSSYITNLEHSMVGMEKNFQDLKSNYSLISSYIAELLQIQHFNYLGTYQNHDYYVSKEGYGEINNVMDMCKSCGGYLVEIDNEDEFNVINGYFFKTSGFTMAIIAGTDEANDGIWVFQSSNKSLPFTKWAFNGASTGNSQNCLVLYKDYSWNMADYNCKIDPPEDRTRYTCEIPRV